MKKADYDFNLKAAQEAITLEMDVETARAFLDGDFELGEVYDFTSAIDEAQGPVHSGEKTETYIVIRIVKTDAQS